LDLSADRSGKNSDTATPVISNQIPSAGLEIAMPP